MIRLTLEELLSNPIEHYLSGLDKSSQHPRLACGRPTTISGYTEWLCWAAQPMSLGWDWQLGVVDQRVRWQRTELPRTNVQIINSAGVDLPWVQNLHCLATVVDSLAWPSAVRAQLASHQSNSPPYQS